MFAVCFFTTATQFAHSQTIEAIRKYPPIKIEGDIASHLVSGVDKMLLNATSQNVSNRRERWEQEIKSAESAASFIAEKRKRLAHILGVRDQRVPFDSPELVTSLKTNSVVASSAQFTIHQVRFPVLDGLTAEGLLIEPAGKAVANLIVIPDADQTPEQLCGLDADKMNTARALAFANRGCRVFVPAMISRKMERRRNRANLTHREYVYRSAFEMGRHLIGYEIQKVLAAIDWFEKGNSQLPNGVAGYGEGALIACFAAALDPRIDTVSIDTFLGDRDETWRMPVSRNVFGLLNDFGDAELLAMTSPRLVEVLNLGELQVKLPSEGGAPGELKPIPSSSVQAAVELAGEYCELLKAKPSIEIRKKFDVDLFLKSNLGIKTPGVENDQVKIKVRRRIDNQARMQRMVQEMDRFNQKLLRESEDVRREFMKGLDTSSQEKYQKSVERYREIFRKDIIGDFELPLGAMNPRARKFVENEKYTGFEIVLDVFDDVIAYGILLVPNDLKQNEKRPVVVCQHGLEGRPQDIVQGDHRAYHDFAAKLAEQGFITFSPQNLYIFTDRFRTLQRKANPLGKTLFSIIVPQHQQIVNWLKKLPNVDDKRIAFYGLSYGGKSAMRIPPLVTDYCLSICSADFNDWVWKNASTKSRYSYVWTGEYEIFEFDLGSTFNYSEMAALIAPRPFMVERGHFDGVSSDERVAYEFAKVRHLYQAKLGMGDRCELEFFVGPHTINGKGTYEFLHKHLNWPKKD